MLQRYNGSEKVICGSDFYIEVKTPSTFLNIPPSRFKKMNEERMFKKGYNEETDVIVITDTGRIDKIYIVEGIKIGVGFPSDVSSLPNAGKPVHEQYFRYTERPNINKFNINKHIEFIKKEYNYRKNGYYFYNKGNLTYITGSHYYHLNLQRVDTPSGRAYYVDYGRIMFYFMEACKLDERCLGLITLKGRRIFFSTMALAFILNNATLHKNHHYGIISKKNKDAEVIFDKARLTLACSPFYHVPETPTGKIPKTSPLLFRKKGYDETSNDIGLNTIISYEATALNSYDGDALNGIIVDEISKWPAEVDFDYYWKNSLKKCLVVGKLKRGIAICGSSANKLSEGGQQFKDLYYDSVSTERLPNGQTKSGLYKIFIPMSNSMTGYFNIYGEPVLYIPKNYKLKKTNKLAELEITEQQTGQLMKIGSLQHMQNNRKSVTQKDLYIIRRLEPETEEEAFYDVESDNDFDKQKLEYNLQLLDKKQVTAKYTLSWIDKEKFMAKATPNPNGMWEIFYLPPKEDTTNHIITNNINKPINKNIGVIAVDSYDKDKTSDSRYSKGAILVKTFKGNFSEYPEDMFIAFYLYRPAKAFDFYEEVMKIASIYKFPILIENANYGLIRYLESNNMSEYILTPKKYNKNKNSKGIPATEEAIVSGYQSLISYIETLNNETKYIPFQELVKQLIDYDHKNRTFFDAVVAAQLACIDLKENKKEVNIKYTYKDVLPMVFNNMRTNKEKTYHTL